MQFEPSLTRATLLRRYRRFLADVETADGDRLVVHCPNTGAMTGCVEPGNVAWISTSQNPRRKYRHTLEIVETRDGHRIGVHSARANRLVEEALARRGIRELPATTWRCEPGVPSLSARFDFALEFEAARPVTYVEVKSVTWHLGDGCGAFPDTRSDRATRHLRALISARRVGHGAALFFCAQHDAIERVVPADAIDPAYAAALRDAADAGVQLLAYRCELDTQAIRLATRIPVEI